MDFGAGFSLEIECCLKSPLTYFTVVSSASGQYFSIHDNYYDGQKSNKNQNIDVLFSKHWKLWHLSTPAKEEYVVKKEISFELMIFEKRKNNNNS